MESIPGLGLKTSHELMRKWKSADRIIRHLRFEGRHRIPREYDRAFRKAESTFLYQRVFDPINEQLVYLNPLPSDIADEISEHLTFVGP